MMLTDFATRSRNACPRVLAFNGKTAASIHFQVQTKNIDYGHQPNGIQGTVGVRASQHIWKGARLLEALLLARMRQLHPENSFRAGGERCHTSPMLPNAGFDSGSVKYPSNCSGAIRPPALALLLGSFIASVSILVIDAQAPLYATLSAILFLPNWVWPGVLLEGIRAHHGTDLRRRCNTVWACIACEILIDAVSLDDTGRVGGQPPLCGHSRDRRLVHSLGDCSFGLAGLSQNRWWKPRTDGTPPPRG